MMLVCKAADKIWIKICLSFRVKKISEPVVICKKLINNSRACLQEVLGWMRPKGCQLDHAALADPLSCSLKLSLHSVYY
jgi:hypothetical protein